MSLLAALLASSIGGGGEVDPPPYDPGEDTTPYAFPTTAPYNVGTPAITPTYDGSGQTVHPSVIDFENHGMTDWQGYRYWMAVTPYPLGQAGYENPSILASHDGYTWHVPGGMSNPIETGTGASDYNSDTELAWDAANARAVVFWRRVTGTSERLRAAWSTDGTNWTPVGDVFTVDAGTTTALLSPSVVQVGPSDWRMVAIGAAPDLSTLRTASSPLGPWSAPQTVTFTGAPVAVTNPWHFGMVAVGGVLHGLLDLRDGYGIVCCTSTNGVAWAVANPGISSEPIRNRGGGTWDSLPYRAALQPHENGTHMRVWYSATASGGKWNTGYTQIPLTAWPAPPT